MVHAELLEAGSSDRARAHIILRGTPQDVRKMIGRRRLLQRFPELGLSVATDPLKRIIAYDKFLCHPTCSIARGDAQRGSDIDCALVVTGGEEPIEKQIRFVEELRRQGFVAVHPSEDENGLDSEGKIIFLSRERLESMNARTSGDWYKAWLVFLAGFEIT